MLLWVLPAAAERLKGSSRGAGRTRNKNARTPSSGKLRRNDWPPQPNCVLHLDRDTLKREPS